MEFFTERDEPDFSHNSNDIGYVDKELEWKKNKIGYFSASDLSRLMSKSGIWTKENIDYLYEIQYARTMGVLPLKPNNRFFRLGRENEVYAIEWLREHFNTKGIIRHYDVDFEEKPFIKTDFGFGMSPDADEFVDDEIRSIIEIKSAVGNEQRSRIFSPTFPYDRKRIMVWEEHKWQIIGQLIGKPDVNLIHLLKYDSLDSENDTDERSILDERRGILFSFTRSQAGKSIVSATERLTFANNYLQGGNDPDIINEFWKKRNQ